MPSKGPTGHVGINGRDPLTNLVLHIYRISQGEFISRRLREAIENAYAALGRAEAAEQEYDEQIKGLWPYMRADVMAIVVDRVTGTLIAYTKPPEVGETGWFIPRGGQAFPLRAFVTPAGLDWRRSLRVRPE